MIFLSDFSCIAAHIKHGMPDDLQLFTIILGLLWFLVYWILGGVFFALVAILRLGRVRKVRFSCLFSILAFFTGAISAFYGVQFGKDSIRECVVNAKTQAEVITAIFGCGFAGIFGVFLIGAAVLVLGGFLLMAISKSKTKPWIVFDQDEAEVERKKQESKGTGFFE